MPQSALRWRRSRRSCRCHRRSRCRHHHSLVCRTRRVCALGLAAVAFAIAGADAALASPVCRSLRGRCTWFLQLHLPSPCPCRTRRRRAARSRPAPRPGFSAVAGSIALADAALAAVGRPQPLPGQSYLVSPPLHCRSPQVAGHWAQSCGCSRIAVRVAGAVAAGGTSGAICGCFAQFSFGSQSPSPHAGPRLPRRWRRWRRRSLRGSLPPCPPLPPAPGGCSGSTSTTLGAFAHGLAAAAGR